MLNQKSEAACNYNLGYNRMEEFIKPRLKKRLMQMNARWQRKVCFMVLVLTEEIFAKLSTINSIPYKLYGMKDFQTVIPCMLTSAILWVAVSLRHSFSSISSFSSFACSSNRFWSSSSWSWAWKKVSKNGVGSWLKLFQMAKKPNTPQ